MIDSKLLKAELIIHDKTIGDLAKDLEISRSAVSKKVNGKSEWTHSEIQKIGELLGAETMNKIFFASEVS